MMAAKKVTFADEQPHAFHRLTRGDAAHSRSLPDRRQLNRSPSPVTIQRTFKLDAMFVFHSYGLDDFIPALLCYSMTGWKRSGAKQNHSR